MIQFVILTLHGKALTHIIGDSVNLHLHTKEVFKNIGPDPVGPHRVS